MLEIGPSRRLENVAGARGAREMNAAGRVLMPGLIDARMRLLIPEAGPGQPENTAPGARLLPHA